MDADCYALAMISIATIEELHSHNHTLALYCLSCDRWGLATRSAASDRERQQASDRDSIHVPCLMP